MREAKEVRVRCFNGNRAPGPPRFENKRAITGGEGDNFVPKSLCGAVCVQFLRQCCTGKGQSRVILKIWWCCWTLKCKIQRRFACVIIGGVVGDKNKKIFTHKHGGYNMKKNSGNVFGLDILSVLRLPVALQHVCFNRRWAVKVCC